MQYCTVVAGFFIISVGAAPNISVSAAADDEESPSAAKEFVVPTVQILTAARTSTDDKARVFVCVFTHPNKKPVKVLGYSDDIGEDGGAMQPLYKIQLQRAGKWENYRHGWCGNELINSKVAGGARGKLHCAVPVEPKWTAVRVGVPFGDPRSAPSKRPQSTYAWSKPVTLDQIDAADGKKIPSD